MGRGVLRRGVKGGQGGLKCRFLGNNLLMVYDMWG